MQLGLLFSGLSLCTAASAGVFGAADLKRDTVQADPISGLRWLRIPDPARPDAPPRLVLLRDQSVPRGSQSTALSRTSSLCVHTGDHLRLHAATTALHSMTLDAVSSGNAACGGQVRARVTLTGKLVDVAVTSVGAGVLIQPSGAPR